MAERKLKRRLFVASGLLVIASAAWWLWSSRSVEQAVAKAEAPPQPFVQLAGEGDAARDRLLRERAAYFDPTPLFLPTAQNFGQGGLPSRLVRQPGEVFGLFTAKLHFPESGLAPYAAESGVGPENLPDLLGRANEAPFAGFGEVATEPARIVERGALIEVRALDGRRLARAGVGRGELPRTEFAPLEFVVGVSAAGVIGKPMLATSSGWEDVDAFFRDYLTKTYRIGERLEPGRYRVLIGP